ncbi:hypothetical protein TEA_003001 [Camellia sinensis var. sinensis]|uniref:Thioredoxin domain-containing protein n=1 Tax=Camellia sinensis var. sinensis TaxID=542762 RepID=A0A4S4DQG1_CAMSN|nr:hypothetical protein TEA_003001 [Camellia sinensis var. sinensis]
MALSRLLFSSFKNRFTALTLFRRFVPSKRIHCSSYMRSARRIEGPPVLAERTPSSHLWMVPTAALLGGFGGVALFLYYNDEKRAILKGCSELCFELIGNSFLACLVPCLTLFSHLFLFVAHILISISELCYRARVLDVPRSEHRQMYHQGAYNWWPFHSDRYRGTVTGTLMLCLVGGFGKGFEKGNGKGQGQNIDRCTIKGPIIGGPFTLIDTEGRLVTERNLLGNSILLYFGYTSSPDVGPAEQESKQNLKVLPVFVTIDPQRDTPSQLRAYLREFDSRIMGLTGSVPAIRQMAQEYRVYFKKVEEDGDDYLVESSHNMYLTNPNMEVVRCFGVEYSAEELSEAILKELTKPEHNRLTPVLCSSSSTG